jgi:hypothetical protein
MSERKGSHSTVRGFELRAEHDALYKKMLIGKKNDRGTIINAEWIGNSVYGIVKCFFDDGTDALYSHRASGFRPRKIDFDLTDTQEG